MAAVAVAVSQSSSPTSSQIYAGMEPNRSISPGLADSTLTLHVVCTQSTSVRRNVSDATKRAVYAEYHVTYPQPQGMYEVDHIIPLTIGGSNDIKNLWLQPAKPVPGFHQKDALEDRMHARVCSGKESLRQAQQEMATDWYGAYKKYIG